MTIHNYYRIVDDVKKIIYNLELLMVMISSLHRPGVDKMSVLTLVDKTTHMLVKMFKNFKCKYKHFISNVMDKYNRIMIMVYIRVTITYTIDERILKNCIYMIYNDYSKYYIYNDFTEHDKKIAESDAYVNSLFCRIIEVLSDFIKFIECKIAKYGNVTRVGYEGAHENKHSSNYSSHEHIVKNHIDYKNGHKHSKHKKSDTSSHDRYIKSSTKNDSLSIDKHNNGFKSDSTSSSKCEDNIDMVFHKRDKHDKHHNNHIDSDSDDSFDPRRKGHKHHKTHHHKTHHEDKCDNTSSSLPEIKCKNDSSCDKNTFIVSDSSSQSNKSGHNTSSMSEFSFMEFDKSDKCAKPQALQEMAFLIEHGDANPNGEGALSTDYEESSDEIELDAMKQQKYLIDNNIQNPNNSKKYKKVCDELTCNSSDIKLSSDTHDHRKSKSKVHELSFDKTSEVCDYPSETIMICNDSSPHSSDYKHKHKHSKHKHTKSIKHHSHDPVLLSISSYDCGKFDGCVSSPKKCNKSSTDSLMCNESVSFSEVCEPYDKVCEKYKHYIPQTKKILKSIHEMLKCSKLDATSKRDVYNTVMKIKNNKHMYHIFKIVAKQCDCDFDEMVKAVCKMSLPVC